MRGDGLAARAAAQPAAKGLIGRLMARAPTWVRRHERFPCCVIAALDLDGRDLSLEGLVTEISQGGALFRPASHFIFDRRGSHVTLRFAEDDVSGRVVNVKALGYGIEFDEPVSSERVQDMLARYGLTAAAAQH